MDKENLIDRLTSIANDFNNYTRDIKGMNSERFNVITILSLNNSIEEFIKILNEIDDNWILGRKTMKHNDRTLKLFEQIQILFDMILILKEKNDLIETELEILRNDIRYIRDFLVI